MNRKKSRYSFQNSVNPFGSSTFSEVAIPGEYEMNSVKKERLESRERKKQILIIDDDSGTTETLSDIFTSIGYPADVAGNGFEAVEMIRERLYDVALIDIKMPGMNGIETFRKLKEINPSIKAIMITGYCVDDQAKNAFEEGALGIFYKPLSIDKLVNTISDI